VAIYLTEDDVRGLLTMETALECLEEVFQAQARGQVVNHPRSRIPLAQGSYNLMSAAWLEKGVVGQKSYVATRAGVGFHVMLYSARGEGLLAIFEASRLGQVRTGAASGLASKYMARPDSSTVALIGAGYQARTQLEAVAKMLPIESAKVFSRSAERRQGFSEKSSGALGIDVRPACSAEECVDGADVVVAITNARDPVLLGQWFRPGIHVNAAGNNSWLKRELDADALARCDIVATDDVDQAKIECGELMHAIETGRLRWDSVASLADVVSGRVPGRNSPSDITLFESQGVAMEDVAVAERLYRMARERGIGVEVPGPKV
jgi:ornithine cyclodeaminase/alanine dehydrogenase-like protein (mu-crystallin family)